MKKNLLLTLLLISTLQFTVYCLPFTVSAADFPNNKFGIHLAQPAEEDLKDAAALLNGSGGDWGYVTLVLQENDRDKAKWQNIFDTMRELHLIPIIRLATQPEGNKWRRPNKEDTDSWIQFLDSLNWVIKNRYIILFNEPNHASEWGGAVDAENYAEIASEFADKLAKKNEDFFVMLAGLDAAAPSSTPFYEDEQRFLSRMISKYPDVFDNIKGWSSHSYPNPGFSGSPFSRGRNTITTYQWELSMLKELGIEKDLPVFITETGWLHNQNSRSNLFSPETVANYLKIAYQDVWLTDDRVFAVTPFILNYQTDPFLGFSWRMPGDRNFYQSYYTVSEMSKTAGKPPQIVKLNILTRVPEELLTDSSYNFKIEVENQGQAILDKNDSYRLSVGQMGLQQSVSDFEYFFSDFHDLKPFQKVIIDFHLKTGEQKGRQPIQVGLFYDDQLALPVFTWNPEVLPRPTLKISVAAFPKLVTQGDDFEIQIFDRHQELVFKQTQVKVRDGVGTVKRISNIALDDSYRIVVLRPYYLPRQQHIVFKRDENAVNFKKMLPVDFNKDGKLWFDDLWALLINLRLLKLWWV